MQPPNHLSTKAADIHQRLLLYCENEEEWEIALHPLLIMEQMKIAEGVTEKLKCTRQMEWVQRCNNIRNRAEEIVLHEMIYL